MLYDAILPAGGRIDAEFASRVGTDRKALIEFEGETILGRTLGSLEKTGRFQRIVLIGPPEVTEHPSARGATIRVPEAASGPANIAAGLKSLENSSDGKNRLAIITTDLPFLTDREVMTMIDADSESIEMLVPVCKRTTYQARFPNSESTYIELKDGGYTAGGVFLTNPNALRRAMGMVEKLFENRKSKLGMAKLLGPVLLAKFLTKSLTINDVERKAMSLLGIKGKAMLNAPPELAYDIDYFDDYEYALNLKN